MRSSSSQISLKLRRAGVLIQVEEFNPRNLARKVAKAVLDYREKRWNLTSEKLLSIASDALFAINDEINLLLASQDTSRVAHINEHLYRIKESGDFESLNALVDRYLTIYKQVKRSQRPAPPTPSASLSPSKILKESPRSLNSPQGRLEGPYHLPDRLPIKKVDRTPRRLTCLFPIDENYQIRIFTDSDSESDADPDSSDDLRRPSLD